VLMFRMPNKRKMSVQNEREVSGHFKTVTLSFRAKRGTPQKLFDHTNDNARSFIMRATVS